jgi:CheY-like chemotaxis protein/anti-sigma regulatory factor (Ser/Thr protein kinase)
MATALVVDDSKMDQILAGRLLQSRADMQVRYAENGQQALELMAQSLPDVVLTDMQMPVMDGLQLVASIRERFPTVPVLLMTAHGSEEVAAEALRKGAASYVPKKYLSRDLAGTVERMLHLAGAEREVQSVIDCLSSCQSEFIIDNDLRRIRHLVAFLRQDIGRMRLCDATELMQIGVALDESISNAVIHGNLEVNSEVRESGADGLRAYMASIEERRTLPPYSQRRVFIRATITKDSAEFVIRDDGKGFDPSTLPDPTDPSNIGRLSGRGLYLIRNFMDEVTHNDRGNELRLFKRRAASFPAN